MLTYDILDGAKQEQRVLPDLTVAARSADRTELARSLAEYQRELGAPDAAVHAAESLTRPDAAVIVTGQQPGLLGGPILVLAKALSAIAWAKRLAVESGCPVVPVFWVASEDHDLPEVNAVTVLDQADRTVKLSLPLEPGRRMLSEIDPGEGAQRLLNEVRGLLPQSEFLDEVLEPLLSADRPSLGRWFAGIISRWLGGEGLVVVEPHLFRTAARGVLDFERERPGAIAQAVAPGPVTPVDVPFFKVIDGMRSRVASIAELPASPEGVSWDVLTRVLAQNLALPVAGHVVGPSEALYCAQVAPAHALLGISAPPLLPRASLLLMERKVSRALTRFETTLPEVLQEGEAALEGEVFSHEGFDRALTELENALQSKWLEVTVEAARLDETLRRKAEGAEQALLKAIDKLKGHGRKAMDRVTGRDREQRDKVLAHLLPGGKPQERVLSPLPFMARHGADLPSRLLKVVEKVPDGRMAVRLWRG